MLYGFVGLELAAGGEASFGVIGNSVLAEAAFDKAGIRGGRDVRTDLEARKLSSSCGIATDFENKLVKPSINMK